MTAFQIYAALREVRFNFTCERELQEGIAKQLTAAGVSFRREHALTERDRIDFLCGSVGIEVKIKGSAADLIRQLHRYAERDEITAIILVTSRAQHRAATPRGLNGKPIYILHLPTAFQ